MLKPGMSCAFQLFKRRGIQRPYTWQLQCLKVFCSLAARAKQYLERGRKTFVAEVLLLRTILGRMRSKTGVKCLMVLPFVSLVKEKAKDLEPFGDALSIWCAYFSPICIATIEKADRIIKELIEESRMSELSLVVVDEAHFVAEKDHLAFLVKEAIQDKAPVIIFCATKASTEIVAKQLTLAAITGAEDTGLQQARNDVISALRSANEDANSDISLFAAISVGVSFHHSGLSSEERQIIEDAYKSGTISVLVATTTLVGIPEAVLHAAGVNLPAGRVIVRTPYTGREFLTASRFKQMAGRAGRAGLGQKQGEAFLFVQPGERDRCFALVTQGPKAVESQLLHEAFQYSRTRAQTSRIEYVSSFYATSLGKATYLASIAVEDALALHHDLELARSEGIILVDQLHLLYLTAPVSGLREPNWSLLADKISQFDDNRKKVLQRIGIEESFVCLSAQGRLLKRTPRLEEQDFKSRRLWVALLLQELVEEKPVAAILRVYGAGKDRDGVGSAPGSVAIDKGYIEELQTVTASFASMVAQFSRNVGFEDLASLIQSLTGRIANGARSDVLPLCDIPFVQAKRAREMFRNGLRTVEDVASAKPQELVRMLGNLLGPTGLAMAKKIIQSAQNLHRKRLMELSQGMEIFAEEEEVEALS
ncbi:hypothetical protein GUITHDRAFT_166657 [Guillardia theta CCMP2712]|uniref:Uncharacterized protein n=1 Tax=Guillardia theta (strain CCMP2712) TaxID=905079 RepID=L1I9Y3_GUITC|nr:hypothetical protein GUITHDRAFT_166657 [Guillardia theta CCMP2712]EKX32660.1 hypothetical protein GUITHDRAFT_166657 [Guillardia theta CCMP2712]|eukprot:XP_005819640.1 hypothetical protein GUITHDRAFT_166657 [Guillardia theta CCMP2712]